MRTSSRTLQTACSHTNLTWVLWSLRIQRINAFRSPHIHILGISCFYHDAAAALVRDGVLIAAAEEERFTRKKHSFDFPTNAINYCLREAGIHVDQLDYVVFYEKPFRKFERILTSSIENFPRAWGMFAKAIPLWLGEKIWVRSIIEKKMGYKGKVLYLDHHLCHAASSFLVSPFEKAAILTIDGIGELASTTCGIGEGNSIRILREIRFPHSLGLLYSTLTAFLGFKVNNGEGKVMGLAAYGEPAYEKEFQKLIHSNGDGSFGLNLDYFAFPYSAKRMFSDKLIELFGQPRVPESEVTAHHENVAASLQKCLEDRLLEIATRLYEETRAKALCLSGGVALNSVANYRLLTETPFEEVFIQPAAGDDGAALGAAFYVYNCLLNNPRKFQMKHAHWGPEFSSEDIERLLMEQGAIYDRLTTDEIIDTTAQLLSEEKIVGWFHGRMEFGPRALGARSILADPRRAEMKDILNARVKHREAFRPFAPSVLRERSREIFVLDAESPYMLLIGPVEEGKRADVPAITHADGTARVQTVTSSDNGIYYDLIKRFGEITGVPAVLNTSFNIRGEPIVCTPADAYNCFMHTDMDYLSMGNFLVKK